MLCLVVLPCGTFSYIKHTKPRLHNVYISDQSLFAYKKHLSILTLNLTVFVPKMVKINFFETNVEFVPKTFLQIAIIKEKTSLG